MGYYVDLASISMNAERKLYNAHIGAHDMKLCIEAAKGLSFDIEYEKIRKLKPQT